MRNRAQTSKQQQAREQAKDQPFPSTKQKVPGEKMNIQSDPGIFLN